MKIKTNRKLYSIIEQITIGAIYMITYHTCVRLLSISDNSQVSEARNSL